MLSKISSIFLSAILLLSFSLPGASTTTAAHEHTEACGFSENGHEDDLDHDHVHGQNCDHGLPETSLYTHTSHEDFEPTAENIPNSEMGEKSDEITPSADEQTPPEEPEPEESADDSALDEVIDEEEPDDFDAEPDISNTGAMELQGISDAELWRQMVFHSDLSPEERKALEEYYASLDTTIQRASLLSSGSKTLGISVKTQNASTGTQCGPSTTYQTMSLLKTKGKANAVPSYSSLIADGNPLSWTEAGGMWPGFVATYLNSNAYVFYDLMEDINDADTLFNNAVKSVDKDAPPVFHMSILNPGTRNGKNDVTRWPYPIKGHILSVDGYSGNNLLMADPAVIWKVTGNNDLTDEQKAGYDDSKYYVSKATAKAGLLYLYADVHNHKYDNACSSTACNLCGLTRPAPGHNYSIAATCTSPKKCSRCLAPSGSPNPHNYSVAANCVRGNKCATCSATSGAALGHSFTVAATCTSAKKCSRCTVTSGAALGHNYATFIRTINNPTCTSGGLDLKGCTRCSGQSTVASQPYGHSYTVAATCTRGKKCVRCSATTGSALGHNYTKLVRTIHSATCTNGGLELRSCSRCSSEGTVSTPAYGHNYAAATCTVAKKCRSCGSTSGSSLGHNYTVAATCTRAKKCSRCSSTTGSALGHSYNAATCTKAKTCKRCSATSGSSLGHSYTVAANCTRGKKCSRCSATSGSALGHSYTVAATCTKAKKCSRCTATTGSALGHKWTGSGAKRRCSRCGLTGLLRMPSDVSELGDPSLLTDLSKPPESTSD